MKQENCKHISKVTWVDWRTHFCDTKEVIVHKQCPACGYEETEIQ